MAALTVRPLPHAIEHLYLTDPIADLGRIDGVKFCYLEERDVVRHSLVQKIVRAYERYNEAIGANRQLALRLTVPGDPDPTPAPAADAQARGRRDGRSR